MIKPAEMLRLLKLTFLHKGRVEAVYKGNALYMNFNENVLAGSNGRQRQTPENQIIRASEGMVGT